MKLKELIKVFSIHEIIVVNEEHGSSDTELINSTIGLIPIRRLRLYGGLKVIKVTALNDSEKGDYICISVKRKKGN